ncbi:MAG: methyltransferase domain-containing protein [Anaerolineaceae bacterium]
MPDTRNGFNRRNYWKKLRIGSYYRWKMLSTVDEVFATKRVLDVGSHDGFLLSLFPDTFRIAVDITIPDQLTSHPFVVADAKALPFTSQSFNLVLFMDVIEHIADEDGLAESLARILDQDGKLILSTPSAGIKLFPIFLTNFISKQWGHIYRLGYSSELLNSVFRGKFSVQIEEWNAPLFRLFYLPMKFVSLISKRFAFFLLDRIATYDSNHKNGLEGYLLLTGKVIK